ncbi:MAG: hypothetical protein OHK0045_22750 [Raineya sp.]
MKKTQDFSNKQVKPAVLEAQKNNQATISNEGITANILADLETGYKIFEALLKSTSEHKVHRPLDYSFADFVKDRWGFAKSDNGSPDSFYHQLGIDPSTHTIDSLFQGFPQDGDTRKWLAPAIIREAIREGIVANNMYSEIIRANIGVAGTNITMPKILSSDSKIKDTGEGESIVVGTTKFGQKDIKLRKFAYGIEVSYEVLAFVPLNIISTYLEDTGNKFSNGLSTLSLATLINGDQKNGSESAAMIGVEDTTKGVQYADLLRAWIRMQLRGRQPTGMITGENQALKVLGLDEFKKFVVGAPQINLNLKTPIPETQNHWVHGAVPENSVIIVDTNQALVQLTAMDLMLESERIVSKQIQGTYASIITGFANLQRDARVIIKGDEAFNSNGFPDFMKIPDVVEI